MQVGLLGILVIVTLTAGGTFFATSNMQTASNGPVLLTPEVKSYIDSKFATGFGSQVQDSQKVTARIAEMETKISEIERIKANYENLPARAESVESAIVEQRRKRDENIALIRQNEINNLRNEIATMCAGVTIKRVQDGGTGNAGNPSSYQQNIGLGGGRGGAAKNPALRRMRQGGGAGAGAAGGGGDGRRRGGGGANKGN